MSSVDLSAKSSVDLAAKPRDINAELRDGELFWRDHYDWLKAAGYRLRPRFRPGWIPSWKRDPRKFPPACEDAWSLAVCTRPRPITAVQMWLYCTV